MTGTKQGELTWRAAVAAAAEWRYPLVVRPVSSALARQEALAAHLLAALIFRTLPRRSQLTVTRAREPPDARPIPMPACPFARPRKGRRA